MQHSEETFHQIAASLPDTTEGKMFGALCVKTPNGKSGVMYRGGMMVFKLPPEERAEALALEGAAHFDPSGGRPMKEWVEIPAVHADRWEEFARVATEYVRGL